MLRESPNFLAESGTERLHLLEMARRLGQLPVEGFVLGFLRDGEVNEDSLAELLGCAPHLHVTFHRAFEEVRSVTRAMAALKRHTQVDRILTSGGAGEWTVKAEKLAGIERLSKPQIELLCGGGLDEKGIGIVRAATRIKEFHVGRLARTPAEIDGAVDAEKVHALAGLIGALNPDESLKRWLPTDPAS
jgi:copper homeostasis protein